MVIVMLLPVAAIGLFCVVSAITQAILRVTGTMKVPRMASLDSPAGKS